MSKMLGFSSAAIAVLACAFMATPAMAKSSTATTAHKTPTAQQARMATCNKQAKGKHGAEHKAFMRDCLSNHHSDSHLSASQQRMKTCNADAKAKALQGQKRKSFMSTCLKKP